MDGKHATVVAREMGIGPCGGIYAQWDDNNPAWETASEDDSDVEVQSRWKKDDVDNGEKIPETSSVSIREEQDEARRVRGLVCYLLLRLLD